MHQLELIQFCCLRLGPAGRARGTGGPESGAATAASASGLEEKRNTSGDSGEDRGLQDWGAWALPATSAHPLSSRVEQAGAPGKEVEGGHCCPLPFRSLAKMSL